MTQYPLRVPDYLMEQARVAAAEEKVSINQMFLSFIAEGMGHRRALKAIEQRVARGSTEEALSVLERLPRLPPDAGDEMPGDSAD